MHIMIDIETGGTKPGCQIFAIGAVRFLPPQNYIDLDNTFYIEIDHNSYQNTPFTLDPITEQWWKDQQLTPPNGETRAENTPKLLLDWIGDTNCFVWANSPSFDVSILKALFEYFETPWPIPFWKERDVRTARYLADHTEPLANCHNALQDAINQAHVINHCYQVLRNNNDHRTNQTPSRCLWANQHSSNAD